MPHKRAKKSTRDSDKAAKGHDLAPTGASALAESSATSKRAQWVLGAEKVREEWQKKKRGREAGGGGEDLGPEGKRKRRKQTSDVANPQAGEVAQAATNATPTDRIQPGETLGHFNKRIEDSLRPTVRAAMKTSINSSKRARQSEKKKAVAAKEAETPLETKSTKPSAPVPNRRMTKTEFEARPKPTRLNDIVLAPPTLSKGTRKAPPKGNGGDSLSVEQRAEMDVERERVIRRYRELKEMKRGEGPTVSKKTSRLPVEDVDGEGF